MPQSTPEFQAKIAKDDLITLRGELTDSCQHLHTDVSLEIAKDWTDWYASAGNNSTGASKQFVQQHTLQEQAVRRSLDNCHRQFDDMKKWYRVSNRDLFNFAGLSSREEEILRATPPRRV